MATRNHEEEEEEEEQFYESLDRILSSSCSSTSASDNDDPIAENHHHRNPSHRRRRSSAIPRSLPPPPSAAYEVWISEPSSVEERRRRLLQNMGLAPDLPPPPPPVVRTEPVSDLSSTPATPPARSVSLGEHLNNVPSPSATFRSRSEGNGKPNGVQVATSLQSESLEEFKEQCRIRNLDTGSEFVVKEVREDGTWEKLKEISTGRQFTFEEFEMRFSSSPIVQELMRRQLVANSELSGTIEPGLVSSPRYSTSNSNSEDTKSPGRSKKKRGWLKGIKNMAGMHHHKHTKSGDSKDTSAEKGARRLSSVTDDGLDGGPRSSGVGPERIRIRQYGKSYKEFTGVFMTQEIEAHSGAVWSIRFSFDGKYLASAGEDKVICVWEVVELEKKNAGCNPVLAGISDGSPDAALSLSCAEMSPLAGDKKRRGKVHSSRKSVSSHQAVIPDRVLQLGEKPICSLHGHGDDVLDLSWSKSQYLLSSSMDKTVRLWDISTRSCLKTFSHSDYVTCIQFNPVDNRYFISGSLDEKVRVWSIPDRKIVDWYDLHEMVTAACYTPDGQGALVGSHNGGCHLFDTSENKLHYKSQVDLHGRRKKSRHKKITGFQFVPGSTSEVLITSADSRIRVVNGTELVHKLKGFRNTSSQISASISSNGKYVICASEDSHVYIWRYEENPQPAKPKPSPVNITHSYENFHCHHVTVAATWPGSVTDKAAPPAETNEHHQNERSSSATWPEEKLAPTGCSPVCLNPIEVSNGAIEVHRQSAWGLVIVTAARGGQIRVFQNFGFPVHV
ncbi:hypothetical protein LUZ61_018430 [Rhynchospora tenuis]|uniref:WD40 repeat-like protein n=1 Tax=Rhynchospora tenuis TaxID=198213 RepID=A0AAD6ELZ0_9POAL|nr:hypothetical protein LUZ61_018430 [Rhynchospora tenuis]